MRPIPATIRAIDELGATAENRNLLVGLVEKGDRVRSLVPDCVGMSLMSAEHGVTFTLVVSDKELAFLAAVQAATAAPDATTALDPTTVLDPAPAPTGDALDEEAWRLLSLGSAASCVLSTLSMPLVGRPRGPGGAVTLYGASRQAFTGHHEHLADILGGWAPGAVTNADLSFSTLREAEEAPGLLRRASTIRKATRLVAAEQDLSLDTARERLHEAALRAGITDAQLAEAVIRLRDR